MSSRTARKANITTLHFLDAPWADYRSDEQEATIDLIQRPYIAKALPSLRHFAAEVGLSPDDSDCVRQWEALQRECLMNLRQRAYAPQTHLITLFARTSAGAPLALATMGWSRGTRATPIAAAIGDPESSLQTLRMLQGFNFRTDLGFDPAKTPETQVVEYERLCVRRPDELPALVAQHRLPQGIADAVTQHGSSAIMARTFFSCLDAGSEPVAFLYNTPLRLSEVLREKGLLGYPLYHRTGVTPTSRISQGPTLLRRTFDWDRHLVQVVPQAVMAQGTADAIAYLAEHDPESLRKLPISLPFLAPNTPALREALTRLRDSAIFSPVPTTEQR